MQECAELIKSGVILDQFQTRFRPVLRATSTHRAGPPPPQPQPPKREPHRDTSPPAQPQRDHHHSHTHHHPHQQQQSQQHSLGRSQSMPAEKQQRDKERGGGGERPAEKAAGEKLARQPSAAAPAAPPPSPPQSKATSAGGGGAGGGTAAEEDDKKKRKARWVLYEGMYTVWISERTASGNSLSIPGERPAQLRVCLTQGCARRGEAPAKPARQPAVHGRASQMLWHLAGHSKRTRLCRVPRLTSTCIPASAPPPQRL